VAREGLPQLDPQKLHATVARLVRRVEERFPDSGLLGVARSLEQVARDAVGRTRTIARPSYGLRFLSGLLVGALVAALALTPLFFDSFGEVSTTIELIGVLEPALGTLFFVGAILIALATLEVRLKRGRALRAVHELRVLAHLVDVHQLTKAPEMLVGRGRRTASSPERRMTTFELARYLDYCTEMLSLTSKVGALYVQDFPDTVAVGAVDEIENLTTGLARKIWQKLVILEEDLDEALDEPRSSPVAPAP